MACIPIELFAPGYKRINSQLVLSQYAILLVHLACYSYYYHFVRIMMT